MLAGASQRALVCLPSDPEVKRSGSSGSDSASHAPPAPSVGRLPRTGSTRWRVCEPCAGQRPPLPPGQQSRRASARGSPRLPGSGATRGNACTASAGAAAGCPAAPEAPAAPGQQHVGVRCASAAAWGHGLAGRAPSPVNQPRGLAAQRLGHTCARQRPPHPLPCPHQRATSVLLLSNAVSARQRRRGLNHQHRRLCMTGRASGR